MMFRADWMTIAALPLLLTVPFAARRLDSPSRTLGVLPPRAVEVGDARCGAARDLVVQALERVQASSSRANLGDADQLLKTSLDLCSQNGEAWYYRSLVETKLGNAPRADFAMRQAQQFSSDALRDQLNPFGLATPDARSVSVTAAESATPAAGSSNAPAQKWALVIGISQFGDHVIQPLRFTTEDADAFAAALIDPTIGGFSEANVRKLTDAQATGKGIKEELNWIARHANPNDTVVIYVATHGSPRSMDTVAGVNYLITYDTEMFKEGKVDEDAMYATAFPMADLANTVASRMKSLRTLVVLDTCYSGGSFSAGGAANGIAAKPAGPTTQMLERMSEGTGRIVMAASRDDETSLESPTLKHGYFTYYLLQALKQSGGKQPLGQMFASVSDDVSKLAAQSGHQQHPVIFRSSEKADFSLNAVSGPKAIGR